MLLRENTDLLIEKLASESVDVHYSCFLNLLSPSPAYVINKTIEEDRFDIPEVPMEED